MTIPNWGACGECFDNPCTCGAYAYLGPCLRELSQHIGPDARLSPSGQGPVESITRPRKSLSSLAPTAVSREELVEFIRAICEGDVPIGSGGKIHGVRAIELAAWNFYRRLQEAHEL